MGSTFSNANGLGGRGAIRYVRPVPGDRVQMDVCKTTPALYPYTAIDDCSRYKVLGIYPRRTASNTLDFLEQVLEEMPFPIQRIQTDRGREFFAYKVQQRLMEWAIKFRPIKPRSPHLNGKVERSQKTDLQEFWSTVDLKAADLQQQLDEWQHFYNWHRPHTALNGRSPIDVKGGVKVYRRGGKCPTWCVKKGAHGPPSWVVASLHWDGVLRLCLFV